MPKCLAILFNTEMVKAIIDCRKTMTRRVIDKDITNCFDIDVDGRAIAYIDRATGDRLKPNNIAQYQKGDILWVRETFNDDWCDHIIYKADGGSAKAAGYSAEPKWRPSIHMPKEAARIFLRVTDVRAERVQDITVDDAITEGAWGGGTPTIPMSLLWEEHPNASCNAAVSFAHLWDSLNAKRGYGWDTNPWVWVYTFERIAKPANWCAV